MGRETTLLFTIVGWTNQLPSSSGAPEALDPISGSTAGDNAFFQNMVPLAGIYGSRHHPIIYYRRWSLDP